MSNDLMTNRYVKYKAYNLHQSRMSPLNFILRKAELGISLTNAEWFWLIENQFNETIEIITAQEQNRNLLLTEIREELIELKKNPFVRPFFTVPSADSDIALTLYKVNVGEKLFDSEKRYVFEDYIRFLEFTKLKIRLSVSESIPFGEKIAKVLIKIDTNNHLSSDDIDLIIKNNAQSIITSLDKQFRILQEKYNAIIFDDYSDNKMLLLYVLQKIDEKLVLAQEESQYLRKNGFLDALEQSQQIEFSLLKSKYSATQDQQSKINSHLYKVLRKIDSDSPLPESDINFLKKRNLIETLKFALKKIADNLFQKINEGNDLSGDDILWCETYSFDEIVLSWLKRKYDVKTHTRSGGSHLQIILKKLNSGTRLKDEEVVWLEGEDLFRRSSKIYICHYTIEAHFNESEFLRLKDYWKLASASAQWRKAEKPLNAIKLFTDINIDKIKPAKLRAALLTTQGGALRDVEELEKAEKCASKAISNYPDSHNPYTLMGALCYDTERYEEGTRWFEEAIKRGAQPKDQDSEIKKILRKDHNHKLVEYLIKKDPLRFSWVKEFVKNISNKMKS
jgi:tetratricopeptide (TPR) repeat protein